MGHHIICYEFSQIFLTTVTVPTSKKTLSSGVGVVQYAPPLWVVHLGIPGKLTGRTGSSGPLASTAVVRRIKFEPPTRYYDRSQFGVNRCQVPGWCQNWCQVARYKLG